MIEGKAPADVVLRAWPDMLKRGVTVRLGAMDVATNKGWRLASGKWEEISDQIYIDEMSYDLMVMHVSADSAQQLFDDLWRAGFRPKEQPDMDRLLAEANRHNELLVRVIEALQGGAAVLNKKFWDQFT